MKRFLGRVLFSSLPLLVTGFFPWAIHGAVRQDATYVLEDELNAGTHLNESANNFSLTGAVGNYAEPVSFPGSFRIASNFEIDLPQKITTLLLDTPTANSIVLRWIAPEANSETPGTLVDSYEIRYSLSGVLDDSNFLSGTVRNLHVFPITPGEQHDVTLDGLTYDTPYYVSIASFYDGHRSLVGQSFPLYLQTLANKPSDLTPLAVGSEFTIEFLPGNEDAHSLRYEIILADGETTDDEINSMTSESDSSNEPRSFSFTRDVDGKSFRREVDHYFFVRTFGRGPEPTGWIRSDPIQLPSLAPSLSDPIVSTTSFVLNWEPLEGTDFRYQAHVDTGEPIDTESLDYQVLPIPAGPVSTKEFLSNIKGNTTYYYKISVEDPSGEYLGETPTVSLVTHVPIVTDVQYSFPDLTTVRVEWEESTEMNPGDHSYIVRISSVNANFSDPTEYHETIVFDGSNQADFINQKPGNISYYAQITGVNRANVPSTGDDVFVSPTPFYTPPVALNPGSITPRPLSNGVNPTSHVGWEWTDETNAEETTAYEVQVTMTAGDWPASPYRAVTTEAGVPFAEIGVSFANTEYFARVRAVASDGVSGPSEWTAGAVSTWTAVVGAQNVEVEESSNTITVSWADSVGEVENTTETSYSLAWKNDAESEWAEPRTIEGNSDLSLAAEFLNPNTTYNLRLTALPAPESLWPSQTWAGTTVTLATVPVGGLFEVFTDSATVTWEGNGNPIDTSYVLKMSSDEDFPSSFGPSAYEAGIHVATFTSLTANTTYWVRAWGKNRAEEETVGMREWSPQATYADKPTDVTVVAGGDATSEFKISWKKNGNPEGTRYVVKVKRSGEDFGSPYKSEERIQTSEDGENLSIDVSGLPSNTVYRVRVEAVGHNGTPILSEENEGITEPNGLFAPSLTAGVSGTNYTMEVTWAANGNPSGTEYVVQIATDAAFSGSERREYETNVGLSHTFEWLRPNQMYYGHVAVKVTGSPPVYGARANAYAYPAVPDGLVAKAVVGDPRGNVRFGWGPGGNEVDGTAYEFEVAKDAEFIDSMTGVVSIGAKVFEHEVSVPESNRKYFARVRAVASDGVSGPSEWTAGAVSTWTAVVGAQNVEVEESSNTITVSWADSVGEVENTTETSYSLAWKNDAESEWAEPRTIEGNSDLSLAAEFLNPNTTYNLRLTALPAPESLWPSQTWAGTTVTLATVPVGGLFEVFTDSATVTWEGNGNPIDTSYVLKMSSDEDFPSSFGPSAYEAGIHVATFTSLTANTTYWVRAWGKNRAEEETVGMREWSPQATYADKPTDVTVVAGGDATSEFKISWKKNGNPEGTRYVVKVKRSGEDFGSPYKSEERIQTSEDGENLSIDVSGLPSNTVYRVRVEAVGHNGTPILSEENEGITEPNGLFAPSLTAGVSGTNYTMEVTWAANGNPSGTEYVVQIATDAAFSGSERREYETNVGLSHTFEWLRPNQMYYGHVAVKVTGSPPVYGARANAYAYPAVPDGLVAKAVVGDPRGNVRFGWGPGGNEVDGTAYEFEVAKDAEFIDSMTGVVSIGAKVFEHEVSVPESNRKYFARVRAVASDGVSGPSEWTAGAVSTWTAVVGAQNVEVEESSNTITVSWADSVGEVENTTETSYSLAWKNDAESEWAEPRTIEGNSDLSLAAEFLNPNTTYNLRLTALPAPESLWPSQTWAGTTVTLATVPVGGLFEVFTDSATVTWEGNGNPIDTSYVLKMSSDEDFPSSFGPSAYEAGIHVATFTSLTANTTYWVRAWGKNRAEEETVGMREWSPQATYADKPTDVTVVAGGDATSEFKISWKKNGNPEGTRYVVKVKRSGEDFGSPYKSEERIQTSEDGENLSIDVSGLPSNTVYRVRVEAVGHNGTPILSEENEGITEPNGLFAPSLTAGVSGTNYTMEVTWAANGNPSGTEYVVQIATDAAFSGSERREYETNVGLSHTFEWLRPNQMYYGHVAVKVTGSPPVYGARANAYAYPAVPDGLVAKAVVGDPRGNVRFGWGPGGNEVDGTAYEFEVAKDAEFIDSMTGVVSIGAKVFEHEVSVPESNRKYFAHVRAVASDGVSGPSEWTAGAVSTWTAVVGAQGLSVVGATTESLGVTWGGDLGSIRNGAGTQYKVVWSSNGGTSDDWTGSLPGVPLVLGAGGEGVRSLLANTTYTIFVKTLRGSGSLWGEVEERVDGVTEALVPAIVSYDLHTTSVTVNWDENGNPIGTEYAVEFDTTTEFNSDLKRTWLGIGTEANVPDLRPNTTYYGKMLAKNHEGKQTDIVTLWSGGEATDAAMPELTGFELYKTSGSVTWNPNGNPAGTIYRVVLAENEIFSGDLKTFVVPAQVKDGGTPIIFETIGLTSNLPYFARVEVHGHNGKQALSSDSLNGATRPADVDIATLGPVSGSEGELVLSWNRNGNSDRTRYVVDVATEDTFSPPAATTTTVAGADEFHFDASQGLISNQRYFARVKAERGTYSELKSTFTWPSAPDALEAAELDSGGDPTRQVKFVWGHGKNAANTQYVVSLSTGTHLIVPNRVTPPGDTFVSFDQGDGVIWANQKYNAQVKALYAGGGDWVGVSLSTVSFTAPMAPVSVEIPASQISSTTLTVQWEDPLEGGVRNSPDSSILLSWRGASLGGNQTFPQMNTYIKVLDSLSPNTTYYIDVVTLPQIEGPWARFPVSRVGLTNPTKAKLTFGNVTPYQSSMTIQLDGNTNGPQTVYRVEFRDMSLAGPVDRTYSTERNESVSPPILLPARQYQVSVVVVGHSGREVSMEEDEKITKTTLPVSPVIIAVDKPDEDSVLGQKLALTWGPGTNGEFARYETSASVTNRWTEPGKDIFSYVYTGFAPNTLVKLDVRASLNGPESGFFSHVSTQVWTRAQVPGVSQITDPLSNQSLGIRLRTGQNPSHTEFAVRLATADSGTIPNEYEYADLVEPGTPGEAIFTSIDPVWRTLAEWESSQGLKLSSLPLTGAYSIEIYAKNALGQVEGPGGGLRVQQSVGEPVLTLETLKGTVMNHESHRNPVYYNHFPVPIRATNSSHFNVVWSMQDELLKGNNIVASHGWNGAIGTDIDPCLPGSTGFNYKFDGPIQGFCGEEGVYYLNIVGTALVTSGMNDKELLQDAGGNVLLKSTTSFRVFVDSTPPQPAQLEAFFGKDSTDAKLSQNTTYGDPDPYFSWSSTDTLGNRASRSPVVGWTYSVSSDTAVSPDTRRTSANFIPFREEPGVSIDLTEILQATTFYFKVRGYDEAGNWTSDAEVPVFQYKFTPDQDFPRWNSVFLSGKRYPATDDTLRYAAVNPADKSIRVEFSEEMIFKTNAVHLFLVRGPDGRRMETPEDLTPVSQDPVVLNSTGAVLMPFISSTQFLPGSSYRFMTSTLPPPTDNANNALENQLTLLFYTAMDPATPAVFVSEDDVARVEVSAYALGTEPAGMAINDRPDAVSVAGSPSLPGILEKANGALSRGPSGAYRNLFAAKELSVFSTSGDLRTQAFAGVVNLVFSYEKWPVDLTGRMAGTSVRPKDLAIYELDEQTGFWNKMPNSQVDETRKVVTTSLRHNATYGLMGLPNFDLSEAHPWPVPYRASQDVNGINFTNLSTYGTIKIFTLDGRLVKTMTFDGVSTVTWNPVNSDSGDPVGSDVYLYMIENDQQRVVGKLMVIR
jgi:predicted DNA-binding protein with PD1-like motif